MAEIFRGDDMTAPPSEHPAFVATVDVSLDAGLSCLTAMRNSPCPSQAHARYAEICQKYF